MERKQISSSLVYEQLPPLSSKYPWLVAQSLEAEEEDDGNQFFFTINDQLSHYRCRIPELCAKRIQGFFHGWVILSDYPQNIIWSLWNPMTSKMIALPPLEFKDEDSQYIGQCCLSSPPDDPSSVLLLTSTEKSSLFICWLDQIRWTEISYAKQIKKLTSDGNLLRSLTCSNGKVYALCTDGSFANFVVEVEIEVTATEVVINLLLLGPSPYSSDDNYCSFSIYFLKGFGSELFCVEVGSNDEARKTIDNVSLFKLDMTSIKWEEIEGLKDWDITNLGPEMWEEMEDGDVEVLLKDLDKSREMWEEMLDLKDAIFYVDLARDYSIFYSPAISSDLGSYIHMRDEIGKKIHSYNIKDNTICVSSMPSPVLPTSHVSMWECRLENDHEEAKLVDSKQKEVKANETAVLVYIVYVCI